MSLDLPSEAEQAEHDPRAFLGRHPPPLVVDEVQYAPQLFRHLKSVVDANALLRVAAELPRGQVRRCAIICRCPNSYPLASGVQVISLDGLGELLGETT